MSFFAHRNLYNRKLNLNIIKDAIKEKTNYFHVHINERDDLILDQKPNFENFHLCFEYTPPCLFFACSISKFTQKRQGPCRRGCITSLSIFFIGNFCAKWKISGSAARLLRNESLHHCTLLVKSDLAILNKVK